MFTKIFKVELWIEIIGVVITSVILSIRQIMDGNVMDGVITLACAFIALFFLFPVFGMIVEMSENINKCCQYLVDIKNGSGLMSANGMNSRGDSPLQVNFGDRMYALASESSGRQADSNFWRCKYCGEQNDRLADICKGCGKYK